MDETQPWALIIAGGNPVEPDVIGRVPNPDWVIAADSGLDQAIRLGIKTDVVIGDMDSVTPEALAHAEATGIEIIRHPVEKDATDLELAIDTAAEAGHTRAVIIGGTGGRMAHTLANALLLIKEREIRLEWLTSHARITGQRAGSTGIYHAEDGPLLSVLAVGGPVSCESTGLKWPLNGAPLTAGSTRGVSNEFKNKQATVHIVSGQALIIHERN